MLVYSDYPGESLVNNLNLMLTAPDGTRHVGNANAGAGLTMDATNNVEVIQINAPAQGSWRIEVVASSVPESAQARAISIDDSAAMRCRSASDMAFLYSASS